ncbi:MAG: phosphomannomutase [Thiohalospira sp.]
MPHSIADLMHRTGVGFGNGGIRAEVDRLGDAAVYAFTHAFLDHLRQASHLERVRRVPVGGDLRPSSTAIMRAVAAAVADAGLFPVNAGRLPAPALAWYALHHHTPAILVTGSHMGAEANGLKFFRPDGETGRADETALRRQPVVLPSHRFDRQAHMHGGVPLGETDHAIENEWRQRLADFLRPAGLTGWRIGVVEQSTTAREPLVGLLESLGARVTRLGRREAFLALDTEDMPTSWEEAGPLWTRQHGLDALVSADADGDRPLLATAEGTWLRGDRIGALAARELGVRTVVTPVTSTSAVEASGWFEVVHRTRVPSPELVATLQQEAAREGEPAVAGFAAHGGLLTCGDLSVEGRQLPPLPSRDGVLPALLVLQAAARRGLSLTALDGELPDRHTDSTKLTGFSREWVMELAEDFRSGSADARRQLATVLDLPVPVVAIDTFDGIRGTLEDGSVVHLRASGNARVLRIYVEAESREAARHLRERVAAQAAATWSE